MPLNDKQEAFCQEYENNGHNITKAYSKAYPDSSPKSCESNGKRLISNDKIKDRIGIIKAERVKKQVNSRELVTKNMFKAAQLCLEKGDRTNYVRIMENLGKNCGWYAEDNAQQAEKQALDAEQKVLMDEYMAYRKLKLLKGA